jgi:hypothetical protein
MLKLNTAKSQKKGLSIIFGIKTFHQYIAGGSFELITDHRPLLSMFNPAKSISTTTPNRLQRWAILLIGYKYVIRFKPSEQHANANDKSFIDIDSLQINFIQYKHSETWPLTPLPIAKATSIDPILQRVKQFIQSSWPSSFSKKQNPELVSYFLNRCSLLIMHECIMKGDQLVISSILQT